MSIKGAVILGGLVASVLAFVYAALYIESVRIAAEEEAEWKRTHVPDRWGYKVSYDPLKFTATRSYDGEASTS